MTVPFRVASLTLLLAALPVFSQQQAPATTPDPAYSLHQDVRLVLEDVTVTDAHGNVVQNLPASAFHVTDNGQPQAVRSFEEHRPEPAGVFKQVSAPANGTYSNKRVEQLPPTLNVIVLDTTHLSIMEQIYLNYELKNFLQHQPADQPFALYYRDVGSTVMVQDFTNDYQVLIAAAARVLPHMQPLGPQLRLPEETLRQIAIELGQLPGRKNVLWFTGRIHSVGFVRSNPEGDIYFDHDGDLDDARRIYDMLEATRIAVYPIDARGLNGDNGPHFSDDEIATATGGRAFYNNNALDNVARNIVNSDRYFYSLTFSPNHFQSDSKWHSVKVTLDIPGYQLSYRRGYFADPSEEVTRSLKCHACEPGTAHHGSDRVQPDLRLPPILFSVSILPADAPAPDPNDVYLALKPTAAPQKKGTIPYMLRYTLPGDAFLTEDADGKAKAAFDIGVLALNRDGDPVAVKGDQVFAKFPAGQTNQPVKISQIVDLKPGDLFVYVAVWDTRTGHMGTVQVPVKVAKAGRSNTE